MLIKAIAVVGFAAASSVLAQGPELKIICSGRASVGSPYDVYVMNPDGTNRANLTAGFAPSVEYTYLSPSGKKIAFTGITSFGAEPGAMQLYVMNSDGTELQQLTTLNHRYGPICFGWLDDTHVLFRWAPAASQGDLFTIDVTTGQTQLLLASSAVGQASIDDAALSPDRRKIAFTAQAGSASPTTDVYVLNLDTSVAQCLYTDSVDTHDDRYPRWANNSTVVWAHNLDEDLSDNFAIVEKSITSGLPCSQYERQVASGGSPANNPSVLDGIPDTRTMLMVRNPDRNLRRINLDTGVETLLLPGLDVGRADWGILVLPDYSCPADFDGNGGIDGGDLAAFFLHFEQGC